MTKNAMEEARKLFWELFNARNEDELHTIVTENSLLKNPTNWFPYGGQNATDHSNFGIFENQQPSPIPALVEKITNSIDSLLLLECRVRGIDPKSANAPASMQDAVEKFFGIRNGDFSEVGSDKRREIAENIQIIATGERESPNLMIYDNGEGQHPDDFARTFLSLRNNNKTDVRFVQGKYNMGSTGSVVFCGRHRYQLIGSKQNTKITQNINSNDFGFTLVRRHPLTEEQESQYGSSWYEYFVVENVVPRFPIHQIDIGLPRDQSFVTGSLVKLYSYHLPRGSRSDVTLDLWRDLNQFLYQPALPILVVEKRFGVRNNPNKHESKLVLGNKTRILIDDRDKKEKTVQINIKNSKVGEVAIEATVFKPDVEQREFVKDKAVVFTLNGQVQGFRPRRFISEDLGLPMLRDSLLLQVDCTNTRTSFRQDLFMANRFSLKEGEALQTLLDELTKTVKANETLKGLHQARKNRILRENKADEGILKDLFESIPLDPELLKLLKKGGNLNFLINSKRPESSNHSNGNRKKTEKSPLTSKRFPSIFNLKLDADNDGKKVKTVPLNGRGTIVFETDVEDEYLFRPHEKGELQIQILGPQQNQTTGGNALKPTKVEDLFNVTMTGPADNSIKITFEPKEHLSVGDSVALNARLSSPEGDLEAIFYVKIVDPKCEPLRPKEEKPNAPTLPKPIRVFQDAEDNEHPTWKDFGWTGEDIVKIIPDSDGENAKTLIDSIAVNMDSHVVVKYLSKNRINTENGVRFIKDKFFTSVYLHSLFLYGILDKINSSRDEKYDLMDLVPTLMKPYSSFLLYSSTDEAVLSTLKSE